MPDVSQLFLAERKQGQDGPGYSSSSKNPVSKSLKVYISTSAPSLSLLSDIKCIKIAI